MFKYYANKIPNPTLKSHMEVILTIITYRTSLDALSVLGREKDKGQMRYAVTAWQRINVLAMLAVSADRLYRLNSKGSIRSISKSIATKDK